VPLPETIPVKYSEEEAEYLSLRPVVRQTFRIRELVDLILAVTGKDIERVRQVLRSGTAVFHFYRYWWQGFEADAGELERLLAEFPDAQPDRPFRMEMCTAVHFESAPGRAALRIEKAQAVRRRLLRRRSLWDCVADLALQIPPRYSHYSYDDRADCYAAALTPVEWTIAREQFLRYARREMRSTLAALSATLRVQFFCPRQ
jgi:hypothetical protein